MKEKLLKKRDNKRLNIPHCPKWGDERQSSRRVRRNQVGGLANLATSFALTAFVGVGNGLGKEENKQKRKGERQNSG